LVISCSLFTSDGLTRYPLAPTRYAEYRCAAWFPGGFLILEQTDFPKFPARQFLVRVALYRCHVMNGLASAIKNQLTVAIRSPNIRVFVF
jgi:hypothetical protein